MSTTKLSRREALVTLTAGGLAACGGGSLISTFSQSSVSSKGRRPTELPPIDAKRLASKVVDLLKPSKGERAILVHDPSYYPDLTESIYRELRRAGVHPVVALTFEPPETEIRVADPLAALRALNIDTASSRKREAEAVRMLQPLFSNADIFLWLPARNTWPDLRWERLVEASQVRSIHFHWIAAPDGRSAEELDTLTRMYERAVLDTDYKRISEEQERLITRMRGQTIRISAAGGTDLKMDLPFDAWFHKNDGDMSVDRARAAKAVRDREMEVPVGALRFVPDSTSVNGQLSLATITTRAGVAHGVQLEFERGRVVGVSARTNEEGVRKEFAEVGGDIDKIGEIVVGTNPLLVPALPSGELPYFGYGAGYVRISLGDNWESGGTNRSPLGRPLWFLLERATLRVGSSDLLGGE